MLYCHLLPWADEADKQIFEKAKWGSIRVGGGRDRDTVAYFMSKIWFKFFREISQLGFQKNLIAEQAQTRAFFVCVRPG